MPIAPNIADFNHANPVNFTEIVQSGIWAVIMKSRQGLGFRDPAFPKRHGLAKDVGLLVGAYDFATGDDPTANAAQFLAYSNLEADDSAWLDFEDNTHSEMTEEEAYVFLDLVTQKRGQPCGIYGGNRIREQIDPQDKKWIDLAATTPLWQCRYILRQPADNAALFAAIPPIPPWTKTTIIQYTGDGIGPAPHTVQGLQNGADLNVFLGTQLELATAWGGKPAPAVVVASGTSTVETLMDDLKRVI